MATLQSRVRNGSFAVLWVSLSLGMPSFLLADNITIAEGAPSTSSSEAASTTPPATPAPPQDKTQAPPAADASKTADASKAAPAKKIEPIQIDSASKSPFTDRATKFAELYKTDKKQFESLTSTELEMKLGAPAGTLDKNGLPNYSEIGKMPKGLQQDAFAFLKAMQQKAPNTELTLKGGNGKPVCIGCSTYDPANSPQYKALEMSVGQAGLFKALTKEQIAANPAGAAGGDCPNCKGGGGGGSGGGGGGAGGGAGGGGEDSEKQDDKDSIAKLQQEIMLMMARMQMPPQMPPQTAQAGGGGKSSGGSGGSSGSSSGSSGGSAPQGIAPPQPSAALIATADAASSSGAPKLHYTEIQKEERMLSFDVGKREAFVGLDSVPIAPALAEVPRALPPAAKPSFDGEGPQVQRQVASVDQPAESTASASASGTELATGHGFKAEEAGGDL